MATRQIYNLQDLCKKITKGTTPNAKVGGFATAGINFIKSESLSYDGLVDPSKFAFISSNTHEKLKRSIIEENDILYSIAGMNLGKCASIERNNLPANTNQAVAIIRVDEQKAHSKYIEFFLRNRSFVRNILAGVAQSAQPNVNLAEIGKFQIMLPSLSEQKAIASVLGALDDKIENNRQMNETLEEMARAIFKSWFVDFDPVHAKATGNVPAHMDADTAALFPSSFGDDGLPEGWAFKTLGDLVENHSTTYDFTNKNDIIFINTGDVLEGNFLHNKKTMVQGLPGQAKKSIRRGDILYSEIRPKNKRFAFVNMDAKDYVVSTKFMVLRKVAKASSFYIYVALKQPDAIKEFNMIAESRSGTFPQITFDAIKHFPIVETQKGVADKFDEIYGSFFQKQEQLRDENQTLAKLRDTLLPKLMSGEIRVKDAERAVEEAV